MGFALKAAFVVACLAAASPDRAFAEEYEVSPNFMHCGDGSYERAVKDGITLGISPIPPYVVVDATTNEVSGVDAEIVNTALDWAGITKRKYEIITVEARVPSLQSKRIDVIVTNIHVTPDRVKVIDFSGPAWWYGPTIVVQRGNPLKIRSFDDLKGKQVGVQGGAAQDEYARHIGADAVPFNSPVEEFSSLVTGRVPILLEDDELYTRFKKDNPSAPIETVADLQIPGELVLKYGYGYARYGFRKDDCSLRAAFNQGLAEIRGNHTVEKILTKYGLDPKRNFSY
jgi:polar amino acid transport system substrate-binding protein